MVSQLFLSIPSHYFNLLKTWKYLEENISSNSYFSYFNYISIKYSSVFFKEFSSINNAFFWSWNKFVRYPIELVISTSVFGFSYILMQYLFQMLQTPFAITNRPDLGNYSFSMSATGVLISLILAILGVITTALIQSAYMAGIIDIANNVNTTIKSFFQPRNVGSIIIASSVTSIIIGIGTILCIFPGILADITLMFTTVAILVNNLPGIEAVTMSFETVKTNFNSVVFIWLFNILAAFIGIIFCGAGLLVTYPVISLIIVYKWYELNDNKKYD